MKKKMWATVLSVTLAAGTMMVPAVSVSAESEYKIAMILNSSISDGGWGSSCYQAMADAAEEMGWEYDYKDNVATAEYVTSLTDYADLGYNLIFAPGNEYSDAVEQVAEEYPDTYFCLLNGVLETDNIISVLPDAQQIGYMAGCLAGLLTETNNIGFIGGMEIDTTKQKIECFEAAAKQVNPDVNVSSAYAGSYDDAAKGKEIAGSMMSTYDVDVICGDASAVETGAREALAEKENRYSIGQPGDLGSADDAVIACSVVTDNAALVKECMQALIDGEYGNKTIYGNLDNGCLSVGTFSDTIVSKEIQDEYAGYVEQIKAGEFIK